MNDWIRSLVMPAAGTAYAREVDELYLFLIYFCTFFFLLVAGLLTYFVIRYRRRPTGGPTPHITHHRGLEIVWTFVPFALVMLIFFWGLETFMDAAVAPAGAMEVRVTGRQWLWQFEYPNGVRTVNELHVPLDKPVKLVMTSDDVIHSFFVPTFRIKQDVLPNSYTELWFHATEPGLHMIECAEYCGKAHSEMLGKLYVDDEKKYKEWLETGGDAGKNMPPAEWGRTIYQTYGCITCHSLDGTPGQGPSLKGLYGHTVKLGDGRTVTVDDNYIRESILDPHAKLVAGYGPIMPTFEGLLKNRDIEAVTEFIKSLE